MKKTNQFSELSKVRPYKEKNNQKCATILKRKEAGKGINSSALIILTYWLMFIYLFSFNTEAQTTVKVLVIGGGGGGAWDGAGGAGGGGGYQYNASFNVTPQAYSVTVGNGGNGYRSGENHIGDNGQNSVFASITAYGGGGGGPYVTAGVAGGCGGGGGAYGGSNAGGAGSQGGNGGAGGGFTGVGVNTSTGGGGGAGGNGGAGSINPGVGGAGGVGLANSISGSSVYYCGGGAGGGGTSGAAGGNGGGGSTSGHNWNTLGGDGTANTGGGGGGPGGNGGSGIVIISYSTGTITATGGTITTSGGNTIHTFTSGGTFTVTAPPTVISPTATSITSNGALLGANVTSNGGASLTARGTCWGTSANPTTNCVAEGNTSTGIFTHSRTGLPSGTLIYYRGYSTNSAGTAYSTDGTFTTLNIPTVTTPTASSITSSSAILGANVTSDGGATITARGTCWGTSANPTNNCIAEGATSTGVFTHSRTGLPTGTLIHYRGYATNSVGTGYSTDATITTPAPATVDWNNSNVQEITLYSNRSFEFVNGKNGAVYTLVIKQNATGGNTITWPTYIKWVEGIIPTYTTTANAIDLVKFVFDGTNYLESGLMLNLK